MFKADLIKDVKVTVMSLFGSMSCTSYHLLISTGMFTSLADGHSMLSLMIKLLLLLEGYIRF